MEIIEKYHEMLEHTKKLEEFRDSDNTTHGERIRINNILNETQYPMNSLMKWVLSKLDGE